MDLIFVFIMFLFAVLYFWASYNLPILATGIKHMRSIASDKKKKSKILIDPPLVSIVVPVKNEEKVIGRLLDSLLRLDYPQEKKEALEHLDFAIKEFREMKMQPSLERALRHKEILKA